MKLNLGVAGALALLAFFGAIAVAVVPCNIEQEGLTCDDGVADTSNDVCSSGVCSGVCSAPFTTLDGDACVPVCSSPLTLDGTECDDGVADTSNDVCSSGVCSGVCSAPFTTLDGDACVPVCSSPLTLDGTECDDGVADTSNDVCSSGVCAGSCQEGTFLTDAKLCLPPCSLYQLPSNASFTSCPSPVKVGQTCTAACVAPAVASSGTLSRTCLASGSWSGLPLVCIIPDPCLAQPCSSLSTCISDESSSNARFRCDCIEGAMGTPGPDGSGCIIPSLTVHGPNLTLVAAETGGIFFQVGTKTHSVSDINDRIEAIIAPGGILDSKIAANISGVSTNSDDLIAASATATISELSASISAKVSTVRAELTSSTSSTSSASISSMTVANTAATSSAQVALDSTHLAAVTSAQAANSAQAQALNTATLSNAVAKTESMRVFITAAASTSYASAQFADTSTLAAANLYTDQTKAILSTQASASVASTSASIAVLASSTSAATASLSTSTSSSIVARSSATNVLSTSTSSNIVARNLAVTSLSTAIGASVSTVASTAAQVSTATASGLSGLTNTRAAFSSAVSVSIAGLTTQVTSLSTATSASIVSQTASQAALSTAASSTIVALNAQTAVLAAQSTLLMTSFAAVSTQLSRAVACQTTGSVYNTVSGQCKTANIRLPAYSVSVVCNSAARGSLRLNGSSLVVCDGTGWRKDYTAPLGSFLNPASSCAAIVANGNFRYGNGRYWLRLSDGTAARIACEAAVSRGGDGSTALKVSSSCAFASTYFNRKSSMVWVDTVNSPPSAAAATQVYCLNGVSQGGDGSTLAKSSSSCAVLARYWNRPVGTYFIGGVQMLCGPTVLATCQQALLLKPTLTGELVSLTINGVVYPTFCVSPNRFEAFALIWKINGGLSTFFFESAFWTNKLAYSAAAVSGGLDTQEYKSPLYWQYPFTQVRVGMNGSRKTMGFGQFAYTASSLFSCIADNAYRSINFDRNAWKSLCNGSLQPNCNRSGFNTYTDSYYHRARLGIMGNNENECASNDSRIGFGGVGNNCGCDYYNSAGNEAFCGTDNGEFHYYAWGYIMVK